MVNVRSRRLKWILFIAFLVAASVLGTLMLRKYNSRQHVPVAPARPEGAGTVSVSLFFASPDGSGLVREASEIDACGNDIAGCIREAVENLVGGPLGDLAPTLPTTTVINDVQVRDDTVYLDFGSELADGLPGGSSAEMTAVYSIVDTVCFNFPRIRKVKFLQDGREVETLKGHIDLRTPLVPDFTLEKGKNVNSAQNSNNTEDHK